MVNGNAIEVNRVTRHFGDLTAVDELSFAVGRGEIFGLLGPNGAGKTTTINLILGLLHPHQGELRVLGHDIATQRREVLRLVGYVPQETNAYDDLSGEDNLWHHAALFCPDLDTARSRMEELLHFTNLWDRRKDLVRTYSGGMKRRLLLARALLHDPQVIFFDEPTLGVDVQGRYAVWDHIQEQREHGKTFIISTNNMLEADTLCDRLVIIDRGKAIALDSPESLKAGLGHDVVTIRTTPAVGSPQEMLVGFDVGNISLPQPNEIRFEMRSAESGAAKLIDVISQSYQLDSILIAKPSLDDVFLFHTGRALRE